MKKLIIATIVMFLISLSAMAEDKTDDRPKRQKDPAQQAIAVVGKYLFPPLVEVLARFSGQIERIH